MTVEDVMPPTERRTRTTHWPGCWSIELIDPIHNFSGGAVYFHRYVEDAGLVLYDVLHRPCAARQGTAARVALIVGKRKSREE